MYEREIEHLQTAIMMLTMKAGQVLEQYQSLMAQIGSLKETLGQYKAAAEVGDSTLSHFEGVQVRLS